MVNTSENMVVKLICHNAWRDTIHVEMTYKSKTMKHDELQNAKNQSTLEAEVCLHLLCW